MATSSSLALRHRVGQLMIIGFDGMEITPGLHHMLTTMQPSGVILFARNIGDSRQTHQLIRDCQRRLRTPGFACVDMEGGTVDRMRGIVAPMPATAEVARTGEPKLFEEQGRLLGDEVRAHGFNVDFAPVLDIDSEQARNVLGSRTASQEPQQVVDYAKHFFKGLRAARVLGCGKHFPGLGEANLDTHYQLPDVNKPFAAMWDEDLKPYRDLHKDLPFVMVAHAAYPQVTGMAKASKKRPLAVEAGIVRAPGTADRERRRKPRKVSQQIPASLSEKWMSEVLRRKIGYQGLILSDDLEMEGVLTVGTIEHAAIESIRNGADMFLVCHWADLVWRCWEAVLQCAEKDKRFERRVNEAADRVMKSKAKFARELKPVTDAPTEKQIAMLRERVHTFTSAVRDAGRDEAWW